jgi:hypothetical protein
VTSGVSAYKDKFVLVYPVKPVKIAADNIPGKEENKSITKNSSPRVASSD